MPQPIVYIDTSTIREGRLEQLEAAAPIDLQRIDIYGQESALERLRQKAQMLGRGTVAVHEFYAGFAR